MKKLQDILEIFDQSFKYKQHPAYRHADNNTNVYFITPNKEEYSVNIRNHRREQHRATLTFDNVTHDSDEITGTQRKHVHKIFGTVKSIVNNHVFNNPHTTHIEFSSKNDEPSRTKLYHAMARSINPSYEHSVGAKHTEFSVPINNK